MKNAFDLAGRRILITGAAAGIGAATALVCATLGAEIILVDVNESGDVAEAIEDKRDKAVAVIGNAADRAFLEGLTQEYWPTMAWS